MRSVTFFVLLMGLLALEACGGERTFPLSKSQISSNDTWPSDENVQLEKAEEMGLHRQDPLIQHWLIENMKLLRPATDASDSERLKEAYALGLHREDPLIRRRLLQLLTFEKMPIGSPPHTNVSKPSEYVVFRHHFFGDDFGAAQKAASNLQQNLGRGLKNLQGQKAFALGPGPFRLNLDALKRRFGPKMANAVWHLPDRGLSDPILSSFGWHLVQIEGESPGE